MAGHPTSSHRPSGLALRVGLTWAIAILTVASCVTVLSACSDSKSTTTTTAAVTTPGTETHQTAATFQWQPDAGSPYGADVANRRALGIVDGDNGTLYFRAPSADASDSYSLWSLDEQTQERREMAPDCGGMINASADAVYYVGKDGKDVHRFDLKTRKASVVLSGDFQTLLSVKRNLMYVKSDEILYTALVSVQTGDKALVVENAVPEYVECIGNDVYFAQVKPDGGSRLLKMTVGSPGELTTIRDVRGYPLKYLGTRVLCRDGKTVYLVDLDTGKETMVTADESALSSAAANGNGVFCIRTDLAGNRELFAYDLETGQTSDLAPVHGTALCFVDGTMYVVDAADPKIERVSVEHGAWRTEWVVR